MTENTDYMSWKCEYKFTHLDMDENNIRARETVRKLVAKCYSKKILSVANDGMQGIIKVPLLYE
jgi:hypothetical protein